MVFQLVQVELDQIIQDSLEVIRGEHYALSSEERANCFDKTQAKIVAMLNMYSEEGQNYIVVPTIEASLFEVYQIQIG